MIPISPVASFPPSRNYRGTAPENLLAASGHVYPDAHPGRPHLIQSKLGRGRPNH